MAVKTKTQLATTAAVIRDETAIGGNTKLRVYNMMIDLIDSLEEENAGVQLITSSASVVPNWDTDDVIDITAQAVGLTIANASGTPSNGQQILFRIYDNGSAQTVGFGTDYDGDLPTITTVGEFLYFGIMYNSTTSKANVVSAGSVGSAASQFRGAFDATGTDIYPSTGGSGGGGAIMAGDEFVSNPVGDNTDYGGTLSTKNIFKALINTPGSTAANWRIT